MPNYMELTFNWPHPKMCPKSGPVTRAVPGGICTCWESPLWGTHIYPNRYGVVNRLVVYISGKLSDQEAQYSTVKREFGKEVDGWLSLLLPPGTHPLFRSSSRWWLQVYGLWAAAWEGWSGCFQGAVSESLANTADHHHLIMPPLSD